MSQLIQAQRSIIPACDVSALDEFESLLRGTTQVPGIGAYKIGLHLPILHGLSRVVQIARSITDRPLIYDHQKAGTDIPGIGTNFARACRQAGVDAVILFPLAGASTAAEWIRACQGEGLTILVGGHMTQRKFLVSDGGYISDDAPRRIYQLAGEMGVLDFVVPGNDVAAIRRYRSIFEDLGLAYSLYAPGFITQGGEISEFGRVAGERWHAIVGSALYKARDVRAAAIELTRQIVATKG